jgi:hypothetical protein
VVIKSQFRRNTPSELYRDCEELIAARKSGRYVELANGSPRNTVFPAEAAMASDIVIGHLIGGTAPLEAALAGARVVMLNPYQITGEHYPVYAQANILFPSLDDALKAIAAYRSGCEAMRNLGDWSAILPQFDAYRDGRAGHRMRARLDSLLDPCRTGTADGGAALESETQRAGGVS